MLAWCVCSTSRSSASSSDLAITGTPTATHMRDRESRLYPITLLRKKGETVAALTLTTTPTTKWVPKPIDPSLPDIVTDGVLTALLAKVYLRPGLSEVDRYH